MHIFTHTHTYTHSHKHVNEYTHTNSYTYIHTHTYILTYTHMHTLIHTHTHIHILAHTQSYTHTHIHTYRNNIRRSTTHSIKPYLKCLQLNLQYSTKASSNLTQLSTEIKADLAFLQEQYLVDNKPTGFPSTFRLFSFGKGKSRAAVLVLNKSIDSMLISQLSDEDAEVVEVKTGDLNFIAASKYFDIRRNLHLDLLKIRKILDFAKGKGVLLAIDSNSRSKLWHDLVTTSRGKILEEFLIGINYPF
jgi:hypothetical protein